MAPGAFAGLSSITESQWAQLPAASSQNKSAKAVIKVTNLSGGPVANATVNAQWSGLVTGTASGKTDATGQVTFTSKSTSKHGTITITISGLTPPAGSVYDSTKNLKTSASVTF